MKKLLIASFIALPSLAFAGGMGSVDLGDYNIAPALENVSSLMNSSEAPQVSAPTVRTKSSTTERRRGTGFRPGTVSTTTKTIAAETLATYELNGTSYRNYQALVDMLNALSQSDSSYTFNEITYDSYADLVAAVTTFLRGNGLYFLDGTLYSTYWDWVAAYRSQNDTDLGVTRTTTSFRNYGNSYELSNGLEPIDPKDNMYRGQSREDVRQSAAQLKMLRLRGLR